MIKILFICSSWPHSRTFGGQLRTLHIGRALQHVGKVTVLVVSSDAFDEKAMEATSKEFEVRPAILPSLSPGRCTSKKLRRVLDWRFMDLHGLMAGQSDRERVNSYIQEFDLVWVLNSRTPNILQRWHWPRAHLDFDDVPSTYLGTIARNGSTLPQRWKARAQEVLLRRRERLFTRRFTTLSVCSHADRAYLGNREQIHVIPNGFQRPQCEPIRNLSAAHPRLGFIGLYSYEPNVDGVRWFIRECWPAIRQTVRGVRLRLIGKDTDGPLKPTEQDIDSLGWVADPAAEIATWSAMIVPIRLGGGTRIKIAEAFSRKCPTVSTSLGAFGYEVLDGQHLLLADKPDAFSRACIDLIRSPDRASEIADRAWSEFLKNWTWDAITPRVWKAMDDCLCRSNP